ncbi:MAG: phosphate acyltransferase [Gemmatimonadales bacterium]
MSRVRADLLARAAASGRRVVLAEGWDPRVAEAARRLESAGVAVTLLATATVTDARVDRVRALLMQRKPERADRAVDAVWLGVGLVALGEEDAVVAGATCPTADVVRAALSLVGTAPGVRTVSSSFYMVLGDRVLTFTDAGVVPDPTPEQLADIATAAVEDRRRIVRDTPRVAFLSYSTRGSAEGPSVSRVREGLELFRSRHPEVMVDGELQADAALVPEVAERKAPGSPVAGLANILVFPDLDSGNIAYKLVERLAGAAAIGPILQGLARPVCDLSRGASVDDVLDVAAVALLKAEDA